MSDYNPDYVWQTPGATLSANNVKKEYGLTDDDLVRGTKSGKLRCRLQYAHGNPYYKFVRSEIEAFVKEKQGGSHLERKKLGTELAKITTELRSMKLRQSKLEKRRDELVSILGKSSPEPFAARESVQ